MLPLHHRTGSNLKQKSPASLGRRAFGLQNVFAAKRHKRSGLFRLSASELAVSAANPRAIEFHGDSCVTFDRMNMGLWLVFENELCRL
jgi:hypothetical protein